MIKKTIIVSAFPACGKSYFHNKENTGYKTVDSDSSLFSWILDPYGQSTGVRDPRFPGNYIDHIKSKIGEVDFIFVSSHDEVRQALEDNDLCYAIVQPSPTLKAEWIGRCWLRGSPNSFLGVIDNNWEQWTSIIESQQKWSPIGSCMLLSGEHLSNKIYFLETLIGNSPGDLK